MNTITPPLLTVGGSTDGKHGCAMNIISWENGDTEITDYPSCVDHDLARLVQLVNDSYCQHRTTLPGGKMRLCASCSVKVLDLAHRVTGTNGATQSARRRWAWKLLDTMVQHVDEPKVVAIVDAARQNTERSREWAWTQIMRSQHRDLSFIRTTPAEVIAATAELLRGYAPSGQFVQHHLVVHSRNGYMNEGLLTAAHQAVDLWETITGRTASAEASTAELVVA